MAVSSSDEESANNSGSSISEAESVSVSETEESVSGKEVADEQVQVEQSQQGATNSIGERSRAKPAQRFSLPAKGPPKLTLESIHSVGWKYFDCSEG